MGRIFISFEQWCYNNLSKEEADKIMLRWDYELNVDAKGIIINPNDIIFRSKGFNRKGYWFKCLDHPRHKPEQKNIKSFANGCDGSINCNQCNYISITHPHLIKTLVNKDDSLKYSIGTHKKLLMKCPYCNYEKPIDMRNFMRIGFFCPRCSDGKSYPEKFIFNILEQLDIIFKTELSRSTLNWCGSYRYDFYISSPNCIIETHGEQHYYGNVNWKMSLSEIQNNDKCKEKIAKENCVKNYVVLDCRKSELEWIKNSIMRSDLPKLIGFNESDINWEKCHEHACSNMVKIACDIWHSGVRDTLEISNKLNICRTTTIKYLKQGLKLGWCDYNSKEESKTNLISMSENNCKQVICLTTRDIFKSQAEAGREYNISKCNISLCCSNKLKSAGKHPVTNEKLVWMYYDEYIKL